jgi:hypothetical protein
MLQIINNNRKSTKITYYPFLMINFSKCKLNWLSEQGSPAKVEKAPRKTKAKEIGKFSKCFLFIPLQQVSECSA